MSFNPEDVDEIEIEDEDFENYSRAYAADNNDRYEDDVEESEQYVSRFADTTEEERARLSSEDFFDVLNELNVTVEKGRKYFFSKRKIVVEGQLMHDIINDLYERTPNEIVDARKILQKERNIIADANAQANATIADADNYKASTTAQADDYYNNQKEAGDEYYQNSVNEGENEKARIINEAKQQAAYLVSEHNVTKLAEAEAQRLRQETKNYVRITLEECNSRANGYRNKLNEWAQNSALKIFEFCKDNIEKIVAVSVENRNNYATFLNDMVAEMNRTINEIGSFDYKRNSGDNNA